ncbi:MAG TPA: SusC/RagA family TonB-linked outer membrane protein [Chitinophagaceae bacterium]|nr:SusC/RagA family TonB-linked outer membrane protein [Chitinophagaceae bacterium]
MKRLYGLLSVFFIFSLQVALAQTVEVRGRVVDSSGAGVPDASITIKGTKSGVRAANDGSFTINAKSGARLVVSAIGFAAQEITASPGMQTVSLGQDVRGLSEVVVTALGIRREKRQLATATQTINSDQINKSGTGNALSELNGKASGLTVINSGGEPGSGTYLRLRGVTSITGNNQPLMVVDGVPIDNSVNNYDATSATPNVSGSNSNLTGGVQPTNRGVDLNPNDIESITLLKGPSATALYGIQAASGAIIITTKKGSSGRKGTSVSFNSSITFDRASRLPERQTMYSQGGDGIYQGPKGGSDRRLTWGARLDTLFWDGQANIWDPHGNIVGASNPSKQIPVYAYDPYEFFQTGTTYNNNIALSGGTAKSGFRISLGSVNQTGIIPKSKYDKNTFSISGSTNLTDKFSISAGVTYIKSVNDKVQQGSNTSSIMLGLLRTPTTFDNSYGLKDAANNPASYVQQNGTGQQRDYRGGAGYDNPYWTVNRNPFREDVNRVFGYGQANYQLYDWISFTYRLGGDVYSQNAKNAYDIFSNAFPAGAIHLLNYYNQQFNSDFTVNLKKSFSSDLSGSLLVGHNYFTYQNRARLSHGSGFVLPNFLDMSNATSYTNNESEQRKRTMAFYAEAHLDYKNMLFLTLSGRRETSSTLPPQSNSFFYPSASLAFEFTQLPGFANSKVLNYGKLRVSAAQVGKDAPIQGLQTYFAQASIADGFTTGIQFPINGNAGYQLSSSITTIGNPNLKAEKTNSYELGTDLGFFNNRVTLNATAYYSKTTDAILIVPIAYTTGFGAELLNAATLTNKGLEVTIAATAFKTNNFKWDISLNWSKNKNKVVSLATGVPKVLIAGFQNGEVDAIAGKAFGQIYGSVYQRSDPNDMNSPLLINDTKGDAGYGMPIVSAQNAAIGDVNPDWTGAVINTFTYKRLSLGFQVDVRQGGDIWNGTRGAMSYFGTSAETANRDQPALFKGVLGHLDVNGNVVHYADNGTTEIAKPGGENTVATTYSQYYWQNIGSSFVGPAEPSVEKSSFVRLRQVSLTYDIFRAADKKTFSSLSVTLFANNAILWTKYKGVDPETSLAGPVNGQGLDYFNNPGTRSYGIRLNVGL